MLADCFSRSGGGGVERLQLRKLFQQFAVGRVVCLNAAFHSGHFAFAKLHRALGLVALLKKRFFFRLQLCNCFVLLAGIFLPLPPRFS